jgi:hypothetical protein
MISQKAVGVKINLGSIEINGYMLPDGSYRLSKGQSCDIVGLDRKRLSQLQEKNSLKAIIGAGSSLSQKELTKYNVAGQNAKVDLIPIEMALIIWTEVGSDASKALVIAAAAESIERRLDAVVGKVRTEQEYNDRLEFRYGHLKQFHPLYTSWLKLDGVTNTYGTKVNELKSKANLPLISIDLYDSAQLQRLNSAEIVYDAMRRSGRSHAGAMELV